MHTIPAIDRAVRRYSGPTQPSTTKIAQVRSNVAIVMPEIGLEDDPSSPVIRELTVTNRNPKSTIIAPPAIRPAMLGGINCEEAIPATRAKQPITTTERGRSRSVLGTAFLSSPRASAF